MFDFLENLFKQRRRAGYFFNAIEIAPDEWIRIVPVGYFPNHHDGAHQIEAKHVQEMAKNFAATKVDLLFDYEHRSLWGNSIAAGWSSEVEAREDGLYVKYPAFTRRAQEMIEGREYRYFSPVYRLTTKNKLGVEIGATIMSVALTNTPYFDNEIDSVKNSKGDAMPFSKEFLAKLKLPEDATIEQVEAAVNALPPADEAKDKPANPPAPAPVAMDKPKAPEGGSESALEKRISALEAERQAQKDAMAESLVNSAIAEGRILPAEKVVWVNAAKADLSGTRAALEARPKSRALPVRFERPKEGGEKKTNSLNATADYLRAQLSGL